MLRQLWAEAARDCRRFVLRQRRLTYAASESKKLTSGKHCDFLHWQMELGLGTDYLQKWFGYALS